MNLKREWMKRSMHTKIRIFKFLLKTHWAGIKHDRRSCSGWQMSHICHPASPGEKMGGKKKNLVLSGEPWTLPLALITGIKSLKKKSTHLYDHRRRCRGGRWRGLTQGWRRRDGSQGARVEGVGAEHPRVPPPPQSVRWPRSCLYKLDFLLSSSSAVH